jgi:hypothetical protein
LFLDVRLRLFCPIRPAGVCKFSEYTAGDSGLLAIGRRKFFSVKVADDFF